MLVSGWGGWRGWLGRRLIFHLYCLEKDYSPLCTSLLFSSFVMVSLATSLAHLRKSIFSFLLPHAGWSKVKHVGRTLSTQYPIVKLTSLSKLAVILDYLYCEEKTIILETLPKGLFGRWLEKLDPCNMICSIIKTIAMVYLVGTTDTPWAAVLKEFHLEGTPIDHEQ